MASTDSDDRAYIEESSENTRPCVYEADHLSSSDQFQDELKAVDSKLMNDGVREHAMLLGMDPETESDFLWIAKESLLAPVPSGWVLGTASTGVLYYYNETTGDSRWDHPRDEEYRQLYKSLKKQKLAGKEGISYENGNQADHPLDDSNDYNRSCQEYINVQGSKKCATSQSDQGHDTHTFDWDEALRGKDEIIQELYGRVQEVTQRHEQQKEELAELEHRKHVTEESLEELKTKLDVVTKKLENASQWNQTLKKERVILTHEQEKEMSDLATALKKEENMRQEAQEKCRVALDTLLIEQQQRAQAQEKVLCLEQELERSSTFLSMISNENKRHMRGTDDQVGGHEMERLQLELEKKDQEMNRLAQKCRTAEQQVDLARQTQVSSAEVVQEIENELTKQLRFQSEKLLELEHEKIPQLVEQLDQTNKTNAHLRKEIEKLQQLAHVKTAEKEKMLANSTEELFQMEKERKKKELELETLKHSSIALEVRMKEHDQLVEEARKQGYQQAERDCARKIKDCMAENVRLTEQYVQELAARRKLHNRLMEIQGNIRVFCRVRPVQPIESSKNDHLASQAIFFTEHDPESLELVVGSESMDNKSTPLQKYAFEFDHVFQPTSTQTHVFEQTKALIVSALDGFNVCIFAYGQTGSGKTHTMEGHETDRGVNYRALRELFQLRDKRKVTGNFECRMKLSILEVYNETIVDLLDSGPERKTLDVRLGKQGAYVENLIQVQVSNEHDVIQFMKLGHSHRSVRSHDLNEHSSRSHLVFSIELETFNSTEHRRTFSKIHFIDLAGSERLSKTAASGQRLKEALHINRSLSALGDVIGALGSNSKHIPYRNSKLTFLLSESLSGNSKVLMFVHVSPVQWNAWETLCSLNFASRCRRVALGQAKLNANANANANAATAATAATQGEAIGTIGTIGNSSNDSFANPISQSTCSSCSSSSSNVRIPLATGMSSGNSKTQGSTSTSTSTTRTLLSTFSKSNSKAQHVTVHSTATGRTESRKSRAGRSPRILRTRESC